MPIIRADDELGLMPALKDRKRSGSYWLCFKDRDRRVWPPVVWDWAPASQTWWTHGAVDTYHGIKHTAREMENYIIVGEAVPPAAEEWMNL